LARILESDNAETFGSLLNEFVIATGGVLGFSGVVIGFGISTFKSEFSLLFVLIFAFSTSAIE
jgi:hypothetical protein